MKRKCGKVRKRAKIKHRLGKSQQLFAYPNEILWFVIEAS